MSNPMITHGANSWFQYSGPDSTAAIKFYQDVLGWQIADLPMKDGSSYPGILLGETPIGGFSPVPADNGSWLLYITVDDVDMRYKKALAKGARSIAEPISVPGVGRMATITDPQGANIAFITYESMAS